MNQLACVCDACAGSAERELKPGGLAQRQSVVEREERAAQGEGIVIDGHCTGELADDERTPVMGLCDEVNAKLERRGLERTCTHEQASEFMNRFSGGVPATEPVKQLKYCWPKLDQMVEEIIQTKFA